MAPNKITGANAGGPRQLAMPMHWAARVAQFRRSAAFTRSGLHRDMEWVEGFLTGDYGSRGWFLCVPINATWGYISERSGIAGRHRADGDLGRRGFEAMGITPSIQALQRTAARVWVWFLGACGIPQSVIGGR